MYVKYGIQKYAIACEIVARWVNHDIRGTKLQPWTASYTDWVCNTCKPVAIGFEEAKALRVLFGLNSINDLYSNP